MSSQGREETRWRYVLEQTESGTWLTESYEFVWCPLAARIAEIPFPRDKQLRKGVRQTLAKIKEAVEAERQERSAR